MSAWAVPRTSVRSGADSDIGRATTVPWIRYDRRFRKKGGAGTADASGARGGGRTRGSGRRRPTGASSPTMSQLLPDITRNSTFVSCLSAAEARAWSPKAVWWRPPPTVRRERAPRRREATRRGAGKVTRRAMSLSSSRVRSESCRCFPRAACAGVFCVVARIAEVVVCDGIRRRHSSVVPMSNRSDDESGTDGHLRLVSCFGITDIPNKGLRVKACPPPPPTAAARAAPETPIPPGCRACPAQPPRCAPGNRSRTSPRSPSP